MNARSLARAAVIAGVSAIVTVGLVAEYRLRTEPPPAERSSGQPSESPSAVARSPISDAAQTGEPLLGPPSPPSPIYGPPTPPSRVPLLDPSRRFNAPILNVTGEDVVPRSSPAVERLAPIGWDRLALDRGIPFMAGDGGDGRRGPSQTEARRSLFEQAAPDPAPVAIVYCVDLSVGQDDPRMLDEIGRRIRQAVEGLRPRDRFAAYALDAGGTALVEQWREARDGAAETWSRLGDVKRGEGMPLAPGLAAAAALEGVTHIVVIASAKGPMEQGDRARLDDLRKSAPPFIALVIGDGTATPRARALRDLASATHGAFAWLRTVADDAGAGPSGRTRSQGGSP